MGVEGWAGARGHRAQRAKGELGHGEPKGAQGWCWGLGKPPLCLFPTTLWLWWVCRVLSCVVKGWEAPRWERGRCFPPLVSLGVPSHAEISGWVSKSCACAGLALGTAGWLRCLGLPGGSSFSPCARQVGRGLENDGVWKINANLAAVEITKPGSLQAAVLCLGSLVPDSRALPWKPSWCFPMGFLCCLLSLLCPTACLLAGAFLSFAQKPCFLVAQGVQ